MVAAVETDKASHNYEPLQENLARLRARGDLRVATLPMPEPVYFEGNGCRRATRISTSPTAWCWCRRSTIRDDRVALNTLARLFPDREVVGIPCRDLVLGLGTLHCMTQQQPA